MKRMRMNRAEYEQLLISRGKDTEGKLRDDCDVYRIKVTPNEAVEIFKKRKYNSGEDNVDVLGNEASNASEQSDLVKTLLDTYTPKEIENLICVKENTSTIEIFKIEASDKFDKEKNVGIALFSDAHLDEVVNPETVLGLNEYNSDIAEQRIKKYFGNLKKVMDKNRVDELIFASLGDIIGGFIHEELAQTNSVTPMAGIQKAKSLIISGLKYLIENTQISKITFVGICGNHSRTTKKMQYSNGYDLSYEYFMYLDIKESCNLIGLNNIEFIIPKSEYAVIDIFGQRLLFAHGHQFKTQGGIGGIYPALFRWYFKIASVLKIDKAFIGHYHQLIYTKEVIVNGSIKSYDAYAIGHGLAYEPAQQAFTILNEKRGFILFTPIFVD